MNVDWQTLFINLHNHKISTTSEFLIKLILENVIQGSLNIESLLLRMESSESSELR